MSPGSSSKTLAALALFGWVCATGQRAHAQGSDSCASAVVTSSISGFGVFAVDTTISTTGSPLANCGTMGNDVWFYWTSPVSTTATIATCGGVGADSVIALWAAPTASCPTTQLACNDDSCGLQSQVTLGVTAGTSYFVEIGGYLGATYTGTFSIIDSGPCVTFQGFPVACLGQANATIVGSDLVVSNIGSSGQDGVAIDLPAGTVQWSIESPLPDAASMPTGARMEVQAFATIAGVPHQLEFRSVFEDMGSTVSYTIDFSPLGPSSVQLDGSCSCSPPGSLTTVGGSQTGTLNVSAAAGTTTVCTRTGPFGNRTWTWTTTT